MSRADRQQTVEELQSQLGEVRHAVLIQYKGITVPAVTELRKQVRETGGKYRVVKNRLLRRAIADAPLGAIKEHMTGPLAIAWSESEPVVLAKTLTAFAKTAPMLEFKAVLLDGEPVTVDQLDELAALPSQKELQARVVGALVSPLRRLVTALASPSSKLATVLKQKAEKEG